MDARRLHQRTPTYTADYTNAPPPTRSDYTRDYTADYTGDYTSTSDYTSDYYTTQTTTTQTTHPSTARYELRNGR